VNLLGKPPAPGAPEAPQDAADYWLARQSLGTFAEGDEAAFEAWLLDPANAWAFREARLVQELADQNADDPQIRQMRRAAMEAPVAKPKAFAWSAAVAASVVLLAGVGFWFAYGRNSAAPAPSVAKRMQTSMAPASR
jgi:transmembrane sensor